MTNILNAVKITEMAKLLFAEKRAGNRLDGWFIAKEKELELDKVYAGENEEVKKALILRDIIKTIPLYLSDYQLFAGTQDDAFARSYALINPAFKVEELRTTTSTTSTTCRSWAAPRSPASSSTPPST